MFGSVGDGGVQMIGRTSCRKSGASGRASSDARYSASLSAALARSRGSGAVNPSRAQIGDSARMAASWRGSISIDQNKNKRTPTRQPRLQRYTPLQATQMAKASVTVPESVRNGLLQWPHIAAMFPSWISATVAAFGPRRHCRPSAPKMPSARVPVRQRVPSTIGS